ncbi:CapA family protein [Halosquirtibacter laminarini]|uniref:CapA family protein n=1 Tax=Halosquirtibacter laminarini TaxID=3374600 RepID=A0AC61NGX0_9BACT|nr:CapA family protein [Prolixibacteraceae bacterium]
MNYKVSFLTTLLLLVSMTLFGQKRVSMTFIGDIMGHGAQLEDADYKLHQDSLVNPYQHCFQYIKRSLSKSDFTIGNLEVTLAGEPYSGYPTFSSPTSLLEACRNAGIDLFALANNHVMDRGFRGVRRTISALEERNIPYMGAYIDSASRANKSYLVLEKEGIRIGVLNYTYGTNGIAVRPPIVVNKIDTTQIRQDVACLQQKGVDQIVTMFHWGYEYHLKPSVAQKKLTSFMHHLGVRVVIGSHPHVVQPINWNREKGELCVYSLGNFISNQRECPKDVGLIVNLEFVKDSISCRLDSVSYQTTYVHRYPQGEGYGFEVLPYHYVGGDSIAAFDKTFRKKASHDVHVIDSLLKKSDAYAHQYSDQFKDIIPKRIKMKSVKF